MLSMMKMMVMMIFKRQCYRKKDTGHCTSDIQNSINQGHHEKIDLEWQAAQNFHSE